MFEFLRRTHLRPVVVTGAIHSVTDLRTGETVRVSVQAVARDARGRVRTSHVLRPAARP